MHNSLPKPLIKLKQIISKGLEQTAFLFTPVTVAYNWIHSSAKILDNEDGLDAMGVKRCFRALLASMSRWKHKAGTLASGVAHYSKNYS